MASVPEILLDVVLTIISIKFTPGRAQYVSRTWFLESSPCIMITSSPWETAIHSAHM